MSDVRDRRSVGREEGTKGLMDERTKGEADVIRSKGGDQSSDVRSRRSEGVSITFGSLGLLVPWSLGPLIPSFHCADNMISLPRGAREKERAGGRRSVGSASVGRFSVVQ